jgi:hypothetical protein
VRVAVQRVLAPVREIQMSGLNEFQSRYRDSAHVRSHTVLILLMLKQSALIEQAACRQLVTGLRQEHVQTGDSVFIKSSNYMHFYG